MKKETQNLLLIAGGLLAISLIKPTDAMAAAPGGKSRGLRNNNPGNIKETGTIWKGQVRPSTDPPFAQFENLIWGTRAMIILIKRTYRNLGFNTIEKVIGRYAPEIENPTGNYVRYVSQKTGINPGAVLSTETDYKKVIQAMANFENGTTNAIPDETYFKAQNLV